MVSSCRNATTWHAGVVVCWDASAKGLAHAGLVMLGREGSWCLVHRSKQADVHVPPLCSPASALEWNILCRTPLTAPPVCNQQHQAAGQQQWGRATASRGRCHAHPSASPGPQVHSSLFMQADVASTWGRQAACVSPSLPSKGLQWHACRLNKALCAAGRPSTLTPASPRTLLQTSQRRLNTMGKLPSLWPPA